MVILQKYYQRQHLGILQVDGTYQELKNNSKILTKSKNMLSKCVSIPIFFKMKKNFPDIVYKVLKKI